MRTPQVAFIAAFATAAGVLVPLTALSTGTLYYYLPTVGYPCGIVKGTAVHPHLSPPPSRGRIKVGVDGDAFRKFAEIAIWQIEPDILPAEKPK